MSPKRRGQPDTKRQAQWQKKEAEIHRLIRERRFDLTAHVEDKIENNFWTHDDVMSALLNGSIQKVEKDELGVSIDGKKYTMIGEDCYGCALTTAGKIIRDENGDNYLVITAY